MQAFSVDAFLNSCSCSPGKTVLVGVSGGADSVCLLHTLIGTGIPLVAAHFNHGLRPTAERDAEFTAALAEHLGIPFLLGSGDVHRHAQVQGLSLEAAARQLRYQFLFAEATRHRAQAVAVAHHADDQVETILLHLLRGTGNDGLRGMAPRSLPNPWSTTIPLIRPLLSFWKEDILAYCTANGLGYCEDETNLDEDFRRNAIRHTLLPLLENDNPQIRKALWRLAQITRDEHEVVSAVADEAWNACLQAWEPGSVSLDRAVFRSQLPALQRRVLRTALAHLRPGLTDVGFDAVERGRMAIVEGRTGSQVDLVGGLRLEILGSVARLVGWEDVPAAGWPQLSQECPVPAHSPVRLGQSWVFDVQEVVVTAALRQEIFENTDPFQAWVDTQEVQGSLVLRPRWQGARFQPLGMAEGSQKISDLMTNHKIPRSARSAWPLLCAGAQIIWVPGVALAHPVRVTSPTQRAWHLTLKMTAG